MADIFTKQERSRIMSKITGKETKPEILVRKYLFAQGFRFRKNVKDLPGRPDIVLPKYQTAIFVHGCFWHGHKDCSKAALPSTNTKFWKEKISKTVERDKNKTIELEEAGWQVLTVWQCELQTKVREQNLKNLKNQINQ
ncbi:MAG: very short patch repair endonuclease [Thermotogota bacterium]